CDHQARAARRRVAASLPREQPQVRLRSRQNHDERRLRRVGPGHGGVQRVKLLLDTHAFLWFMAGDARLSPTARRAIERSGGGWSLSAAGVWERGLKSSLRRLTLPARASDYIADKVQRGLQILAIEWPVAAAVERLPFHHRDPFDRVIIAQSLSERLDVVTKDGVFRKYGVKVVW